jgi:opacity protein-like surface antigen
MCAIWIEITLPNAIVAQASCGRLWGTLVKSILSAGAPLALAALAISGTAANADAQQRGSSFKIAPRFWYIYDDVTYDLETQPITVGGVPLQVEYEGSSSPIPISLRGASVAWTPGFLDRTTITATFGEGTGQEDRTVRGTVIGLAAGVDPATAQSSDLFFVGVTVNNSRTHIFRSDLEITLQSQLNDSVGLIGGFRREHIKTRYEQLGTQIANIAFTDTTSPITGPAAGAYAVPTIPHGYDKSTLSSGRLGVVGSLPLTDDFKHVMSATGMFFVGYRDSYFQSVLSDTTWMFGPDIGVGYTYNLTSQLSFDARYRAIFYFAESTYEKIDEPRASHGLMLSIAYRFGG